jgi:hypothetical protein
MISRLWCVMEWLRAAVLACSLPIRSADWYIEPASEDAADQEIADFITKAIFEYPSLGWDDVLRQALLCLPFGVMAFEKVFASRDCDGTMRIVWDTPPTVPANISTIPNVSACWKLSQSFRPIARCSRSRLHGPARA